MWRSVRGLVEELLQLDQELPVFVRVWVDHEPDDYLKFEPLYDGQVSVERMDYPVPHVGGYYGDAVVLGAIDDD